MSESDYAIADMQRFDPPRIYTIIHEHLKPFESVILTDDELLLSLFNKYFGFMTKAVAVMFDKFNTCNRPIPSELFVSFELLLDCFKKISSVMDHNHLILMYEAWWSFIACYKDNQHYDLAISQIQRFFKFLGCQEVDGTIVPVFYEARGKELSNIILEVLVVYINCLAKNHDFEQLVLLMDGMESWRVVDEDGSRFTWLVSFLIETTRCLLFNKLDMVSKEGHLTAKLTAVILLEYMQVSRVNVTQEIQTLIQLQNFSRPDFLSAVLDHVAKKTNAEYQHAEDTNELDVDSPYRSCLMQLKVLEENSILHPTLCRTIQSNMLLANILHKQARSLEYIEIARKRRMEGIEHIDASIKNLDAAIYEIGDLEGMNHEEYGAACHVRARALCLRALCNSEKFQNSEVSFKDVKEAIQLLLNKDYSQFVANHSFLSLTTVKLLCYVCDMLQEVQTEGDQEIYEMLIELSNQSSNGDKECIAMIWQPTIHNHAHCTSHESHRYLERISKTYNEDWVSNIATSNVTSYDTDKLKHVAFELERKDPGTTKSVFLAACIYYYLGDKMISEGSFSEALFYANKSRKLRESFCRASFKESRKEKDGSMMIRWHVNPLMATNAWSTDYEAFIMTPNNILKCYLESVLQEGTITEILGDATKSQHLLSLGENLSLGRGWSILGVRFLVVIGKIYRKTHCWELAEEVLLCARNNCSSIDCKKCKAVLEDEINLEFGNYYRKMYCNESIDKRYQLAINHFNSSESRLKNELPINARIKKAECGCEFTYGDHLALDYKICLLRVLTQKAKCFVAKGDTKSAQEVLLESARLVMHVRSFCSLHSETAFSYLVEHVKKYKIKHGVDIADLLYMMSWVSLMKSDYKDTSKKSCGKSFSPPLTIISGLKLALILSSKVPEQLKKVAQLLAILCALPPGFDPSWVGALSACQWSCFFHHLTLGSNLSSMYYSRIKEMNHASDPDAILHSLAPNLHDAGLEDFVIKYFRDLPTHTILGMTVLKEKYMGLLEILLGESFMRFKNGAQWMMMSGIKSNGEPLVVLMPVEPIEVFDGLEHCPSLFRGNGQPWRCPWGTKTIIDKVVPGFQKLIEYIAYSFIPHGKDTEQNRLSFVAWKKCLDEWVGDLLRGMEKWFGDWINILLGEEAISGCYIGTSQEAISGIPQRKRPRVENLPKEPMIMMLDNGINMLPLESILRNQEIYRMPSSSSIFYTYWRFTHIDQKKEQDSQVLYPVLNPHSAYCVVNPDNTPDAADESERHVAHQLRNLHIKGKFLEPVEAAEILTVLSTYDLYLYMGHGNGFQYVPRDEVVKFSRCASTTLIGCYSALLELNGPYIPLGAPLDYILAGSPIAIGNLWGVFPYGSYVVLMELFKSWIGEMSKDGEACIGRFLDKARNSQSHVFRNLDGAGLICYGIPTRIQKEKPKLNIGRRMLIRR